MMQSDGRPAPPGDDRSYGVPLGRASLLFDQSLAHALLEACQAYDYAQKRYQEIAGDNPDIDKLSLKEALLKEPAEKLEPLCGSAIKRSLAMLRAPNQWIAVGLSEQAGNEWRPIQPAAWNYIESVPPIRWLQGDLTLAGLRYRGIRVRPVAPISFEAAALALGQASMVLGLLRALRRGDKKQSAKVRREIDKSLLADIYCGTYKADFLDIEADIRRPITPETLLVPVVEFRQSDIILGDGQVILRSVRVSLPDPFAKPAPVLVAVTNWPEPRDNKAKAAETHRADTQSENRPQEFDRAAFDAEYARVKDDAVARDDKTIRAYMIQWSGRKLRHHRDRDKSPSNQWVDDQLRRLRSL